MIGKTVSHYKITRELGAGGMGVVYEAVDTKLDRTVALKFLPPESTRDPDAKARFVHEAKAASALDHHNVCTIHEIDETEDGQLFLAMACYEGETLKDRIDSGPLPLDDALDIARQVAEGLVKAHERDIVHRDIKPANIFITNDGVVKILDFGLVKLAGQTRMTQENTTLGTVSYMSPEQTQGGDVDQRTDLWSLGVVLYEMLSGEPPFSGDHPQAVIYGILNLAPSPLPDSVADWCHVVSRCLEKDAADRYQGMTELRAALSGKKTSVWGRGRRNIRRTSMFVLPLAVLVGFVAWLASRPVRQDQVGGIKSLMVLPVKAVSEREVGFLEDGMTDALIFELSQVNTLERVMSLQTSLRYRDTAKSIPELGQELNVDAVLESSLICLNQEVRATIRLIDVSSEEIYWVETYRHSLDDLFGFLDKVTHDIARKFNSEWELAERSIQPRVLVDPRAYEAYLKGMHWFWKSPDIEDFRKALGYFQTACALDSTFAPAFAGLAGVHGFFCNKHMEPELDHCGRARDAAQQALALDGNSADPHLVLADLFWDVDGNLLAAEREWDKYFEKEGEDNYSSIVYLCWAGRFDKAISIAKEYQEENPIDEGALFQLGMSYMYARRDTEAIPIFEELLKMYGDSGWTRFDLIMSYRGVGRHQEADSLIIASGFDPIQIDLLNWNDPDQVESLKKEYTELERDLGDGRLAHRLARLHARVGNTEEAFYYLDMASSKHPKTLKMSNTDPEFDYLRADPRYEAILRKVGFTNRMMANSRKLAKARE